MSNKKKNPKKRRERTQWVFQINSDQDFLDEAIEELNNICFIGKVDSNDSDKDQVWSVSYDELFKCEDLYDSIEALKSKYFILKKRTTLNELDNLKKGYQIWKLKIV